MVPLHFDAYAGLSGEEKAQRLNAIKKKLNEKLQEKAASSVGMTGMFK